MTSAFGIGQSRHGLVTTKASTWIQEDGDVPIDFMSADAAHSVPWTFFFLNQ